MDVGQSGSIQNLLDFLAELRSRSIYHELRQYRDEAIMVDIAVPGERWGVEFFGDGHIEVEVFGPSSGVVGEKALERLLVEVLTKIRQSDTQSTARDRWR